MVADPFAREHPSPAGRWFDFIALALKMAPMSQIRWILRVIGAALPATLAACGASPATPSTLLPRPRAAVARALHALPRRVAEGVLPPPAFTDPARRQKLASAFPAIDARLAAAVKQDRVPGFAFGIVIDGELAYAKGFGVRDTSTGAPVDADTVFRIASMTKSFTAMAIVQLRDAGKLALDDPAERYLPELAALPYPTRDSAPITIRELLTHSAGFPEDNPWADRQVAANDAYEAMVKRDGISFSSAPGVALEYSNLGYALLGRIIEKVSGERYSAYLKAHVLAPLGMTSTACLERDVPPDRLAHGYAVDAGAPVEQPNPPDGSQDSAGCLYSSIRDLARYAAFHLAAWPPRDDAEPRTLRRSSTREMQLGARTWGLRVKPAGGDLPPEVESTAYGYGLFQVETCAIDLSVQHAGGLPGYSSFMKLLPEHGVGLIALAGAPTRTASRVVEEVVRLLAATGGLAPRAVTPAPALAAAREAVDGLVARWDGAVARAAFIPTFFDAKPEAALAAELERLRAAHGVCQKDGPIDAENALRGAWTLTCERGYVDLFVSLAPTVPPRIQSFVARGGEGVPAATRERPGRGLLPHREGKCSP
jgi:CubicO group peptidase (beta-lactamase class C family)